MTGLKLSNDLTLPIDVAGEAIGILATRGAGKSYTSADLVEELYRAKVQFAVLDPTGVYWGLRAGGDGQSEGLPIIVLGGAHGDVPLEPTAGALIADLLVDTGQSLILDLSDFPTKGAQTRFVTDFAERLYRRKARARTTLHLVVDEADEFAPQKPMRDEARMVGAMEVIVRRGRSRGLGSTLITQRSAALNKNVLDVIDTLVAMRIGSPRDRAAVESWITAKSARDELGVIESLPSLPTGTAWIWSPVRGLLQKVPMRRIRTFDSYATPKPGESRIEPSVLAPIDLGKLGQQIAATAERAKADDPKELRRRIVELERQVRERPASEPQRVEVPVEIRVDVPVLSEADRGAIEDLQVGLEGTMTDLDRGLRDVRALSDRLTYLVSSIDGQKPEVRSSRSGAREAVATHKVQVGGSDSGASSEGRKSEEGEMKPPVPAISGRRATPQPDPTSNGDLALWNPRGARTSAGRTLDALAWLEGVGVPEANKVAVAFLAGNKWSGGYRNVLGSLRGAGLVTYPANMRVALTDAGRVEAQQPDAPLSAEALQDAVCEKLGGSLAKVLRGIIEAYPDPIPKPELAERVGLAWSGGFRNLLGRLRSIELIDYPEPMTVVALPVLFLEDR
jgi:uncharacterized protein